MVLAALHVNEYIIKRLSVFLAHCLSQVPWDMKAFAAYLVSENKDTVGLRL